MCASYLRVKLGSMERPTNCLSTDRAQKHTTRAYRASLGKPGTEVEVHRPLARLRRPASVVDSVPVLRGDGLILEVLGVPLGAHTIALAFAAAGSVHHARNYPVELARLEVGVGEFRRQVLFVVLGLGLLIANHNSTDVGMGKHGLFETGNIVALVLLPGTPRAAVEGGRGAVGRATGSLAAVGRVGVL